METNIQQMLEAQEAKIDAIYVSVEKTRKYFQIVMWVTIAMVVLPMLGLVFVLPSFISTYTSTLEGLI